MTFHEEMACDPQFSACRAELIAATPEHRLAALLDFFDSVELGPAHPVKIFGNWDERDPMEHYVIAFYDAMRRSGMRHNAHQQPDAKVNVAIGESSAIRTGQVIRYRDQLVNDTLLFQPDLTPDIIGAGIDVLHRLWATDGLIAVADTIVPLEGAGTEPITAERRRMLDDLITSIRTHGIEIDIPVFGTIRGWTTRVRRGTPGRSPSSSRGAA